MKENNEKKNVDPVKIDAERLKKELGARVRELRHEQKRTQADLAYEAALDKTYIASIEQGKRNVGYLNLVKIATALKVKLHQFFEKM